MHTTAPPHAHNDDPDGPDCGVEEHDADCLCDVQMGEPTPIKVLPVQSFLGGETIDYLEGDGPRDPNWTGPRLESFLRHWATAYDVWRDQHDRERAVIAAGCTPEETAGHKHRLKQHLTKGGSVLDAPQALRLPWPEVAATLQALGVRSDCSAWKWTPDDWQAAERVIRQPGTLSKLSRTMEARGRPRVSENSGRVLFAMYGQEPVRGKKRITPEAEAAVRPLLDEGLKPAEIAKRLNDTHPTATYHRVLRLWHEYRGTALRASRASA